MSKQEGTSMIVPIETEIERLTLVLSENERTTNPLLMEKMVEIKEKLSRLLRFLTPQPMKMAGAY